MCYQDELLRYVAGDMQNTRVYLVQCEHLPQILIGRAETSRVVGVLNAYCDFALAVLNEVVACLLRNVECGRNVLQRM